MRFRWFGIVGLAVLSGCLVPQPKNPKGTKPRTETGQQRPKEVESSGLSLRWRERLPNGKLVRLLEMRAATGTLVGDTQTGQLHSAKGILYRENVARARFEAPEVDADQSSNRVVARGGVTINSIKPPGVTVTAKTVTWNAKTNKVYADGDVKFEHTPEGGTAPQAMGGPFRRIVINLETQEIAIPPEGAN